MNTILKFGLIALFFANIGAAFSQTMIYSGGAIADAATVRTCSGTIKDNGGDGNYAQNQDDRVTICPATHGDVIQLNFTSLSIEDGTGMDRTCVDFLYVYQGNNAYMTTNLATPEDIYCAALSGANLPVIVSTSPDGCVSLRLVTDNGNKGGFSNTGFAATISCKTECKSPTARIVSAGTPLYICPSTANNPSGNPVGLDGSTSTVAPTAGFDSNSDGVVTDADNTTALAATSYASPTTHALATYNWNFGDGTFGTGSTTTHTYNTPGVYSATLRVSDNNTDLEPLGCESANEAKRLIYVVPPPTRNSPTLTLKCSNPLTTSGGSTTGTLTATASSVTEVEALPVVTVTPTLLPDGTGLAYTNSANYGGYFPVGSTMSAACYPIITFSLEHSWAGDLYIDLVAPNGQFVRLFNRVGTLNHFGTCSNAINTDTGGCPATYTVVPSGGTAWPAAGNLAQTNITPLANGNCAYVGACEAAYYIDQAFNYAPSSPFTSLNGAPLNGAWTLKITDNQSLDNGKLFNWTIAFPAACFKTLVEISPLQSDITWDNGDNTETSVALTPAPGDACPSGATCNGTTLTNAATYGPYAAGGTVNVTYTVTDEHGCIWPGTATITVNCLLPIELLEFNAEAEMNKVNLDWIVATEKDNDYYTVEKSFDGENFTILARIDSKVNGNTTETQYYSTKDLEPGFGSVYYRLKQTDLDGVVRTVGEKVVFRSNVFDGVMVIPNPVKNDATLIFNSNVENTTGLKIIDFTGKVVYEQNHNISKGSNSIHFSSENFTNGVYFIELLNDFDTLRYKFVKN